MSDEFLEPNLPPSPFRAVWHAPGLRSFYAGVDRGMLYLDYKPGVAWPGLVSVNEKPIGGDIRPIYVDGIRRRNDHKLEEFAATITAFSAPNEFASCMGELELVSGLYLGQQRREEFGFSYRTLIGSDVAYLGDDYEINLIYSALSSPSARDMKTLSNSSDVDTRSWDIETVPQRFEGGRPSARLRLDTRKIKRDRISEIEYLLYGTELTEPRLPTINEIIGILSRPEEDIVEDVPWEPTEEDPVEGGS